jgi:hypothetical protein
MRYNIGIYLQFCGLCTCTEIGQEGMDIRCFYLKNTAVQEERHIQFTTDFLLD